MKRYPGMKIMRGMLAALALGAAACGGEKNVASKSADAYAEAQAKGVAAGGGHDHGGHAATATTAGMDHNAHGTTGATMDHSAHGASATDPHAGMHHGTASAGGAMDHSAHAATKSVDHAAMGHGTAASGHAGHGGTAARGAVDHAAMGHAPTAGAPVGHRPAAGAHAGHGPATRGAVDHAAMGHAPAVDAHAGHTPAATAHAQHGSTAADPAAHDQHAGMQHGAAKAAPAADPHAQHRTAATPAPAIVTSAPRSNAEMQRVQPAATLRGDAFDAPASVSVAEAAKATQGGGHEGHQTRGITPGQDSENPPTPMPATRDGSPAAANHSSHDAAATVYTCPMHPEVTSDKPGTCPKCGMALVKKTK